MDIFKALPKGSVTSFLISGTIITLGVVIAKNYDFILLENRSFRFLLGRRQPNGAP